MAQPEVALPRETQTQSRQLVSLEIKPLIKALVADGRLSPTDAKQALSISQKRTSSNIHPLVILADQKLTDLADPEKTLDVDSLFIWFADHMDLEFFRIDPLKIDVSKIANVVSHAYATRRNILPVKVEDTKVTIAVADPFNTDWMRELNQLLRKDIELVITSPMDLRRYTDEFFNLSQSVNRARRDDDSSGNAITNLEQLVQLGDSGKLEAEDHHIVHIVDWLLQYAFEQRASDIHLEPRREQGEIRFRIDGVLHHVYQVPPNVMNAIINRVKTIGRMDVAEKRRPQDGRLKTRTPGGLEIELRLSTVWTALGEKLVMRIFDPTVLQRSFAELGLTKKELEIWNQMTNRTHGIVLVTGPTGSGKTTTLYSTLKQLATDDVNVCTIEDPIEMVEPSFNQLQVQPGIDITFATGVRALLRQDPDIIMIGEIRDQETAEMAIQASLTGHLVLSTLHTNDAPSAITRMLEVGVPAYLINATVVGVVAQRLVRTLCEHCKEPDTISDEEWGPLVAPWKAPRPEQIFKPGGCEKCRNTGFSGRVGLYEMMPVNDEIRSVVSNDTDIVSLQKAAAAQGVEPLRLSGARKIAAGLTTLEEVYRVAPANHAF